MKNFNLIEEFLSKFNRGNKTTVTKNNHWLLIKEYLNLEYFSVKEINNEEVEVIFLGNLVIKDDYKISHPKYLIYLTHASIYYHK
jgi:hypothetical protein